MACNHEHCEKHDEESNNSFIKKVLYLLSIIVFAIGFLPVFSEHRFWIYLVAVILSGYDLILEGIQNLFHFNFEEDTLMTIAVIAAFAIGEYPESCMVILLFKLGEFIEEKAVEKTNRNISDISKIKAQTANRLINEQTKEYDEVKVEDINVGEKIFIKPGEMVPLDCKILYGKSELDTSALTGESIPIQVEENAELLSGSMNLNGSLVCIVTKDYENSAASKIVDLVYEATNNKGKTENFITKFSKVYTPTVIVIAILLCIIPPVLGYDFKTWLYRALLFLVASCPCSIVISIPLAFFSCVGAISKKGMLVKGTKHIEKLSKANQIAFDKTGTLTTGKMKVKKIKLEECFNEQEILDYIYNIEKNSDHPISNAIKNYAIENNAKDLNTIDIKEIAGQGIYGKINKKEVLVGNKKILDSYNIEYGNLEDGAIYITIDGKYAGCIILEEQIRQNLNKVMSLLRKVGIKNIVMLTGDNKKSANKIAQDLDIEYKAELLPEDKLNEVNKMRKKGNTIFIGDGINDSPVLAASDFGIAMGEGTEIAGSSADAILISNNISTLPDIINISRKTMNIVKSNIVVSLAIKLIVLTLGILGYAPIWLAIFADTGVTLLTVLNSIRIFKIKKGESSK